MNTRFGHVTYTKLEIRHATLIHFCNAFNIDISSSVISPSKQIVNKDSILDANFVYFLMENKTFIKIYDIDYYSNKTIEIISNKIGRKEQEIEEYLRIRKVRIDNKYPLRYISSYKIDYQLGGNYDFLKYDNSLLYEGNFECRRK